MSITRNFTPLTMQDNEASSSGQSDPLPSVTIAPTKESSPIHSIPEAPRRDEASVEGEPLGEMQAPQATIKPISRRDVPHIPDDVKKMGVKQAPSTLHFPTVYDVKVPMADDEIERGLREDVFTGKRWLAEICRYLLLQARIVLKKVGGKVVRERL